MDSANLIAELSCLVETRELESIASVGVVARLRRVAALPGSIENFGRFFHPIRYSFVHMNFIVGARQEMHEIFWAGLARNLFEESGGGVTPAHNELYRQFLRSTGVASDRNIAERPFSSHFNERWRKFAREEPIENAVLAIAIYEILDRPDYQSLYDALSGIDERWNLEFFRLHSAVEHFDMFTEFVDWFYKNVDKAGDQFRSVSDFVITTQRDMWIGLLHELESSPRHDPALQQRDRLFVD